MSTAERPDDEVIIASPLVDASWLSEELARMTPLAVVDCRWYIDGRPSLEAYLAGHIPGAVYLDLDRDLSGPPSPAGGRHPLPNPEDFAETLGRAGISETTPVVAYDDASGSIAARLWWMLDCLGQPCAVLDGGIASWQGPLATIPIPRQPVTTLSRPWPASKFIDTPTLRSVLGGDDHLVLDARAANRYAEGDDNLDPRPGHIPGAMSAPWARNCDPTSGSFLPTEELAERFESLGVGKADKVIAYCGSGVTACHDLLALKLSGLEHQSVLYTGSWSAWGSDPDLPTRTGYHP